MTVRTKERFEDYARDQRCAQTREKMLEGLAKDAAKRGGELRESERLDQLMARIRESRGAMIPVPDVPCIVLDCERAPEGAVYHGNIIAVSGKMLASMSDSVLAFVLAHELAHIALGDGEEQMPKHPRLHWFRKVMSWAVVQPRDQAEFNADRLAYQWLKDVGLEDGAWEFFHWLRMECERSGRLSEIRGAKLPTSELQWAYRHFRSHPSIDERLWQLRVLDPFGEGDADSKIRARKLKHRRRRKRPSRRKRKRRR